MQPSQAVSIGRIVHFTVDGNAATKINQLGGRRYNSGEKCAGIVTRTHAENACNLTLFPDGAETMHLANVPYGTGQPGTWSWPERTGEGASGEVAA